MVKKRETKPIKITLEKKENNINAVKHFLDTLEVGSSISYKNLNIFPIFRSTDTLSIKKLKTLSEAIKDDIVEIKETGTVSEIEVINKSKDTKILILEGETIKGGAQNRVVNTTVILDENSSIKIPTSCIQKNRWNGFDKPFKETGYVNPKILYTLNKTVYDSLCTHENEPSMERGRGSSLMCYASNQSVMWNEIHTTLMSVGSSDRSEDLHSIYKEKEPDIEEAYSKIKKYLPQSNEWVGVASVIDGKIFLIDICDHNDIAQYHLERLIKSHIVQALMSNSAVETGISVDTIISTMNTLSVKEYKIFKSGTKESKEFRYNEKDEAISVSLYNDEVVHILYAKGLDNA